MLFLNYKKILLSVVYMVFTVLFISTIQNNIWPVIFGITVPLQLWIPCLVYWTLYRSTGSIIVFVYLNTINIVSLSVLPLSGLLGITCLIALLLIFFKRVYYVNWMFFSIGTAITLFFLPVLLLCFSIWSDGKTYIPSLVFWIGGGIISWLLSFPLFWFFQRLDQLLNIKPEEQEL